MKVNIALLTVTDTRTIENDKSGTILVKKIKEQNHNLIDRKIVKDEKEEIKKILLEWLKNDKLDVIITTGGTGLTGRDITPEAVDEIKDKEKYLLSYKINWHKGSSNCNNFSYFFIIFIFDATNKKTYKLFRIKLKSLTKL